MWLECSGNWLCGSSGCVIVVAVSWEWLCGSSCCVVVVVV